MLAKLSALQQTSGFGRRNSQLNSQRLRAPLDWTRTPCASRTCSPTRTLVFSVHYSRRNLPRPLRTRFNSYVPLPSIRNVANRTSRTRRLMSGIQSRHEVKSAVRHRVDQGDSFRVCASNLHAARRSPRRHNLSLPLRVSPAATQLLSNDQVVCRPRLSVPGRRPLRPLRCERTSRELFR